MRKASDIKYPGSARLFAFCKGVLDAKFGNSRVIDQDVGQILGFDPADCSHWKKGRKNIKSVDAMRSIATHLGVDERLVIDVASGAINDIEALMEFKGLGYLEVAPAIPEAVRREWQRRSGQAWTTELEHRLRAFFSVDFAKLDSVVAAIHSRVDLREAPLFLPEVLAAYPQIKVVTRPHVPESPLNTVDISPKCSRLSDGTFEIQVSEGALTRPVLRFHVAKALAPMFIGEMLEPAHAAFADHEVYMRDVYASSFAARLLVPGALVREEMKKVDLTRDMIGQLAEIFCVSRSLMNRRLRDILTDPAS